MKLLNKISRKYLLNSSLLLVVAFAALYFVLNWMFTEDLDEKLLLSRNETVSRFKEGIPVSNPPFVEVDRVPELLSNEISLSDTSLYIADDGELELEPFRQSVSYFIYNGNTYKLIVRKSLIEQEDLVMSLLITFLVLIISLSVIMNFLNRRNTKEIFRSFNANLNAMKNYSIKSGEELFLQDTNIDEFIELNNVLRELSGKAGYEYRVLKEFSEDLSHELQTPVAVIKNKLELLMQKELADEEAIESIQKSYQNINKLDKINRSLILLSKLESTDLFDSVELEPKPVIERIISNFTEAAEMKEIEIESTIQSGDPIKCNETLFDILISNLISNAIRHNHIKGKINIELGDGILIIKNTSDKKELNSEEVFLRFNKNTESSGSIGLGLAIAKKIVDKFNFELDYFYEKEMHCFKLNL